MWLLGGKFPHKYLDQRRPGPARLIDGKTEISINLNHGLLHGPNLVDVIVRNARTDATEVWASAVVELSAPIHITAVQLDKFFHGPGPDTVTGRVSVDGTVASGDQVQLRIVDSWGRLVYRAVANLDGNEWTFRIPIDVPVANMHNLRVSLWRDRKRLDEARHDLFFSPERGAGDDDYEIHWFFCQTFHTDRWHLFGHALQTARTAGLSGLAIKGDWEPDLKGYLEMAYAANYRAISACPGKSSDFWASAVRSKINAARIEYLNVYVARQCSG